MQVTAWPRRLTRCLALAALVGLPSCGAKGAARHQLEGSLTQLMDLGWDSARIAVSDVDVALTFVRSRPLSSLPLDAGTTDGDGGVSEDYPLIIGYAFDDGEGAPAGTSADLAVTRGHHADGGATDGGWAGTGPKGRVSREVRNDPRHTFPAIVRGELYFDRAPAPDTTVRGNFHITFVNGTEAACGHTVFGDFEARVAP